MNQEKPAANPTRSHIFTIGEYESYFLEVEIESMLGIKQSALTKTPIVQLTPYPGEGLMAFQCNAGWHIRAAAKILPRLAEGIEPADWDTICSYTSDPLKRRLARLFDVCGLDQTNCHTIIDAWPKTEEEYNRLCHIDLGFACDVNTFRPVESIPAGIVRVTPGHPLWPESDQERRFAYFALDDGNVIARGYARLNQEILNDALWAIGVGVQPEYRRKGLGKAVSGLAAREVIQMGHIALWSTEADNPGSIRIAESLGFQPLDCRIKIPQSALG